MKKPDAYQVYLLLEGASMLLSVGAVDYVRRYMKTDQHSGLVRVLVLATLAVIAGLAAFAWGALSP